MCLTDTVEIHCGDEAADFVYTLLTGLMPPYCDATNPEYRPVGSDTTRRWNQKNHDPNGAGAVRQSIVLVLSIYYTANMFG